MCQKYSRWDTYPRYLFLTILPEWVEVWCEFHSSLEPNAGHVFVCLPVLIKARENVPGRYERGGRSSGQYFWNPRSAGSSADQNKPEINDLPARETKNKGWKYRGGGQMGFKVRTCEEWWEQGAQALPGLLNQSKLLNKTAAMGCISSCLEQWRDKRATSRLSRARVLKCGIKTSQKN